jgi:3-hydroxyacyl-CoA dehydrogenase
MNYSQKLQKVAILGAAGKMGSGITLLTILEMASQLLKPENSGKNYVLYAIDVSDEGLTGLQKYLRSQILKVAEKKTVFLRKVYENRKDLIENEEIIHHYVNEVMSILRPVKSLEAAYEAYLVFEAISENMELKTKIFSAINQNNPNQPWFLSNTSSIPIGELDRSANLGGRIIGFHFYNPPAVQKLVELISSDQTIAGLKEFSLEFAKNLGKKVILSNDVAGFIGNGHFMRDALFGIHLAERLTKELSLPEAILAVNKISQEYLIRPMGIFQLMDYVGIDVCQLIMKVMHPHFPEETIQSDLIDLMCQQGVKGGQNSDGSQKDGFMKYEKNQPVAVYNPDTKKYIAVETLLEKVQSFLGKTPAELKPWKTIVNDPDKDKILTEIFSGLNFKETAGAQFAIEYFKNSAAIAKQLVSGKVALSENDVNAVLMNGFYHAYGPANSYLKD